MTNKPKGYPDFNQQLADAALAQGKVGDAICLDLIKHLGSLVPAAVGTHSRAWFMVCIAARMAGMLSCEAAAQLLEAMPVEGADNGECLNGYLEGMVDAAEAVQVMSLVAAKPDPGLGNMAMLMNLILTGYEDHSIGVIGNWKDKGAPKNG